MMPQPVVIKYERGAYNALRKAPGVESDLRRRAAAIARAAGPGMKTDSRLGRNRARASVFTATPEAMRAEASERALTRALGAGRG